MRFIYLLTLSIVLVNFLLIDYRLKLAFFNNPRRTAIVILLSVLLLAVWDILGIKLGIFFEGPSWFTTGIFLLPHFPVEEVLFLINLSYISLVSYRFLEQKWQRT
ncbi:MAG TPA: lycopene cyclase domain-containing protein [Candidatus Saccharimonadales bacterium]|nr:lycopene cyclase domain-containing protein [Candidatus Saccharimonadales bacterium]